MSSKFWFAAALTLGFGSKAAAHGGFPAAVSLLAADAEGATLVRLTHGLAYRADGGFRLLCPEAWGGDVSAPIAAIPGGPVVIGGEQLYLLEPDGQLTRHESELGQAVALSANSTALFGLFRGDDRDELVRISTSTSERVAAFKDQFSALAARDDELALSRFYNNLLLVQTLAPDGALRTFDFTSMGRPITSAELRSDGDELYAVIGSSAAPWFTLARWDVGGWSSLLAAESSLAGPLSLAGSMLYARDGALETLPDVDDANASADYVTCLGSVDGQPFACVREGLVRVDQAGLGTPLFTFAELREPDYALLPESARADCETRFRDLSDHLASAGLWQAADQKSAPGAAIDDDAVPDGSRAASCSLSRGAGGCSIMWLVLALLVRFRAGPAPARRATRRSTRP